MKLKLFIAVLFISSSLFATDRFVDPNLSSGNGTTLFKTINSAVTAAVNGDRILITAGTYNEPTLTLNKSLTLLAQTAGTIVNFNGNIVITGFPGMKLEILGFNLGIYSILSNAITGGSGTNRAKISIIDSKMADLSINQDYYELNCAKSTMTGKTTFRYGNFVVSKTNDLYVFDEPLQNLSNSKVLIACDTITNYLEYRNDDHIFNMANNILNRLYIYKWNNATSNENKIMNNNFMSNSEIFIPQLGVPAYNFNITSNYFIGVVNLFNYSVTCNCSPSTPLTYCTPGYYDGGISSGCNNSIGFGTNSALFPNPDINGFFKWTYNGIDLPCTVPNGSQPLVLTKIIGTTGTITDTGNPNHDYYDIDLTINDRGRTGGPFSILNYNPTGNPSNGKAYIFDLEMPADLFTGQQVDIKAKGYHKN